VRTVPEKQNIPRSQESSWKTKYTTQSGQFLKNKLYHTVRTVPEKQNIPHSQDSSWKADIRRNSGKKILATHIDDRSVLWLGTGISVKSGGVKLIYVMKLYSLNFYITKYFFVVVSVQFHKLTKTFTINKTYRPFNSELFCFQINQSDFKEMYAPMLAIILFEVLSSKAICGMLVCFLCNFVME
jgi:hypothetical protein